MAKTTKPKKPIIDPTDDDFGAMLNWAVRYCLGRMTYAPSMTIQFITPLIPYLSDRTLWCFDSDIEDHKKYGLGFGMDFDERDWMMFWENVKAEIKKRNEISGKRNVKCGRKESSNGTS